MNDNSAIAEFEAESKSAELVPDDTQNTDFTQVACCAFPDEPEKPNSPQARADLINENLTSKEERSSSLGLIFNRMFGLK